MTADQVASLSIAGSLLSALIACWSLKEAKRARADNKALTTDLRKAELISCLIDTTNMGYQVINVVHDCLEFTFENGLKTNKKVSLEFDPLLGLRSEILNKIKDLDEQKNKYMKFEKFEFKEIEQAIAATYAQLKAWENEICLATRSFSKVKQIAETQPNNQINRSE